MNGHPRQVATKRGAAERLLALEDEERRLGARMHRDMTRRNVIGEEITRLRCGMGEAEAERYRKIRFREERL